MNEDMKRLEQHLDHKIAELKTMRQGMGPDGPVDNEITVVHRHKGTVFKGMIMMALLTVTCCLAWASAWRITWAEFIAFAKQVPTATQPEVGFFTTGVVATPADPNWPRDVLIAPNDEWAARYDDCPETTLAYNVRFTQDVVRTHGRDIQTLLRVQAAIKAHLTGLDPNEVDPND